MNWATLSVEGNMTARLQCLSNVSEKEGGCGSLISSVRTVESSRTRGGDCDARCAVRLFELLDHVQG
jgi:hypothetical protein